MTFKMADKTVKAPGRKPAPVQGTDPEPTAAALNSDQTFQPITAEEQAIAARTAADSGREWETILENSTIDYSLGRDKFELPAPALKAQVEKHFAFRWIARTTARIDAIRNAAVPERWWICNSTNTPFLVAFLDPVLGCVTREDQILVFKPWWMHEKMKAITAEATRDRGQGLERLNGQRKGDSGLSFAAGKRTLGDGVAPRQEIRGTDRVVFDEGSETGDVDVSDITTD